MWNRGLQLIATCFLAFAAAAATGPAWAVVSGEIVITERAQAIGEATITFVDDQGEEVGKSEKKSDDKGGVFLTFDDDAMGKTVTVVVTKKDGTRTAIAGFVVPQGDWGQYQVNIAAGAIILLRGPYVVSKPTTSLPPGTVEPITVGSNSEVGSGARAGQKIKETATGMFGGLIGGILGGGSGGGDSEELELATDPIPEENKRVFTDAATGTKIKVGLKMAPNGLLVSTTILKSPDDGTFQTVFLQDASGKRAGPTRYDIYEMYQDWKLTVWWTRDRWVDGQHVEHSEGGWSDEGREILGTFNVPRGKDGIWNRLGFPNAVKGILSLGTLFPVGSGRLHDQPMTLVIHLTRPSQNPVTTTVFALSISPS